MRALSLAAVEVMEENGPDVPLDEIAQRAGVAKRTVYRWVDSKDDLLFIHPRLWLDVFDAALEGSGDLSLLLRIQGGARAVCATIDADPDPVLRSMRLALLHPQLFRGYTAISQMWIDRMAAEVRPSSDTADERFRARVIGAAVMGVIDAALFEWTDRQPRPQLTDLVEAGLRHVAPLLVEDGPPAQPETRGDQ